MRKIRLKSTPASRLEEHFSRELNDRQRAAATAPDGYNLILAGPGSGKTRVITYRVAHLIARGVAPEAIMLVTFTRRAAREMVHRLDPLIGDRAARVWAGTFHHIGNRLLRRSASLLGYRPNFTILDGEDQLDLLRLAMDDAEIVGTGKMAPRPAQVLHLLSFAANVRRPIDQIIADRHPDLAEWAEPIAKVGEAYAARKLSANCMDYDDLLLQWGRLIAEFPEERDRQASMFRHLLIDEMQDTNAVQVGILEQLAAAGAGNLTAVGDDAQSIYRFRGADYDNILQFADRHPGAGIFRLEVNYRSTPQIVALTRASIARNRTGFPKELKSARSNGVLPLVVSADDAYDESSFVCDQVLEQRDRGLALGEMAILYRNHHDSILLQGELLARGIPYTIRSGLRFFEQAHIKDVLAYLRIVINPRDEPSWRRLLLLIPGVGPAKASALFDLLAKADDPMAAIESAGAMAILPARSKGFFAGFVADLRKIRGTDPEAHPAAAIGAIIKGGYPAVVKQRYERPDNRIADIEQFALLADKYESLERLIADLILAGDVYGMDSVEADEPKDVLVLSTIHQAKGLEWSHVFIPRMVEEGFPHRRALDEPGGEEEERRIFYVGISRARDELTMSYPLCLPRGARGPVVLATPSRFLTELDEALYERAQVESPADAGGGGGWPTLAGPPRG